MGKCSYSEKNEKRIVFVIYLVSCYVLYTVVHLYSNRKCDKSLTTVSGTLAPTKICSGRLIFQDEFLELDMKKWQHENTLAGGANSEFQWYTNNRSNSFVHNGTLYIKPTLTSEIYGENFLFSGTIKITGGAPAEYCTDKSNSGCTRTGNRTTALNPVRSARIRTTESFAFKYGRLEISAKMPTGDWLRPYIGLLPRYNVYSSYPSSGGVSLVESRGNKKLELEGIEIGVQKVTSALHWGPSTSYNQHTRTHWEMENKSGFNDGFHKYSMEWAPDYIKFSVDGTMMGIVRPPLGGMWEYGKLNSSGYRNPWKHSSKIAPFDQEFYIVIGLAVGGVGYFPEEALNPFPKPWMDDFPVHATTTFWNRRKQWLLTWNLSDTDDAALQVDYVRVFAL